jgi:thiol-disulfide isomerase/thioredoxin
MKARALLLAAMLAAAPIDALADEGGMPPFGGATGWLNSAPLTAAELRGKVVLVDFWTYTCINWLRQLPYVRAWAEKYKDHGLVVIGVHTPEFEFEKNLDNVRRAAKEMGISYPIAVDNDYAVWRAFRNNAWPALYFVDAQGRIRHHYLGEGEYERSEKILQQLLAEAGAGDVPRDLVSVEGRGIEAAADWGSLKSPETYLGPERAENRVYTAAARLRLNQWTVSGSWTPKRQAIVLGKPHGRIAHRFHARDLHLVMGPAMAGSSVRFRVLIDGKPPGAAHGVDIDAQGNGTVTEQRMYQLIRQPKPIGDRTFEIEFLDPGVEAFAFTFG